MPAVEHYCSVCGETVFCGSGYEYEYPPDSGNVKTEVEGEYEAGAGKCEGCGREFCAYCGGIEGGLCEGCRSRAEEDGEDDYLPF
jgi:hypothetical protein